MRPPRLQPLYDAYAAHPVYFVTFGTSMRRPLLNTPVAHAAFLTGCGRVADAGNAIGSYLLMPDHVHLFIRMGWQGTLGMAVRSLRSSITRALRREGCSGEIWQDGFFDHLLRQAESYSEKWTYVRMNPVRAGLVARPEDWPYQGEVTTITW
jgi:putative transposase